MNSRMLDQIAKPFNVELPPGDTMDERLGRVLPSIRKYSEDLYEEEYYIKKNWIEIRDDEDFHEIVLHIFEDGGQHLCVTDGDLDGGSWQLMHGKFVLNSEVYELSFLDEEFFVIAKHGNYNKFDQRYRMFVVEPLTKRLEWDECIDFLFDKYRNSNGFMITITLLIVLIIALALLLS